MSQDHNTVMDVSTAAPELPVNLLESRLAVGDFAFTLEELTEGIRETLKVMERGTSICGLLLAIANRDYLPDSIEWLDWAEKTFKLSRNHLQHLRQAGSILISLRVLQCNIGTYRKVYLLPFNSLLALAPLPRKDLKAFCERYTNLDKMDREKIRAAVRAWPEPLPADWKPASTDRAEQLTFNLFDDKFEKKVDQLISREDFELPEALALTLTGKMLCEKTIPMLAAHPEEFDRDDLGELEDLHRSLDAASRRVLELVTVKKREFMVLT